MAGHVARAEIEIDASPAQVWEALTDPGTIAAWMGGSVVETDWQPGSPITWTGEYDGRSYQDRGTVLTAEPGRRLVVTHYSPLSGAEDTPENYHSIDYQLETTGAGTHVLLEQDGNDSEEQAEQFAGNWTQMLEGLKATVEKG